MVAQRLLHGAMVIVVVVAHGPAAVAAVAHLPSVSAARRPLLLPLLRLCSSFAAAACFGTSTAVAHQRLESPAQCRRGAAASEIAGGNKPAAALTDPGSRRQFRLQAVAESVFGRSHSIALVAILI